MQPPQQVFVERSADRDIRISCLENHMQLLISMDTPNIAKIVRDTDAVAEMKFLSGNMLKKKSFCLE